MKTQSAGGGPKSKYFKFIIGLLFVILASPVFAKAPKAAWSTDGMLINNTPGNTPQQNPQITNSENGNYIIVWEDGRSGYINLYAQRINEAGAFLWHERGTAVCEFRGNQNSPQIINDGTGGAIIVWQDYRLGNSDIFAQRINAQGQVLWSREGTAICTAEAGQFAPQIISDGSGGAIITWHDYRSGQGEDIFAQRIDPTGKLLWEKDGIAISATSGTQWYPKIVSDGEGGAIITWTDGRSSPADNNIYAQRIDLSGKSLWEKDGVPVCSAPGNQENPVPISIPGAVIIAWQDSRLKNIDIFAQKIDLSGNTSWDQNGVEICTADFVQEDPRLAPDGLGGAIVVWTDERVEESDIYAQRIDESGIIKWQENGRPIIKDNGVQKKPQIIKLNEEWIIVWNDNRHKTIDLFIQKINEDGTPLWDKNGILFAAAPHAQESPSLAPASSGNIIVAWQDSRFGNNDIYAQKISSAGNLAWEKTGIVICAAQGSVVQQKPVFIENGKREIILVFEDARSGFFNIYAQKISKSGNLAWGAQGIAVAKVGANQAKPQLVPDERGGAIICWEDFRNPKKPQIHLQRLNAFGEKIWGSNVAAAKGASSQTNAVMVSDNNGGAIIAWQDDRNVLSLKDIYAQRISSKGELLWGKAGKIVISANGDQKEVDMISDSASGAILVWTDHRRGERNPDIYAQRINAKGTPLWTKAGGLVCGAPDIQRSPKLIGNGSGGAIISWTDKGGGSYDIYAQQIDKSGRTLWMTDGIPINQLSRTQQNPKFGNESVLVWEDYRLGNWDLFAAAFDPSGKLLWGEEGIPVARLAHTQYAPQVIQWKKGSVIVVWEDYRSGKQYEIYLQKLGGNGKPLWDHNGIKVKSKEGGRSPKIIGDPLSNSFYVFWEDYAYGNRAIFGQKFISD